MSAAPHIVCTVTTDLSYDQRMQRICTALAGAGYRVTLVGRRRPASVPLEPRPYAQHRLVCRARAGKAFYLEYNYRLYRYLRATPFDGCCAVDLDTIVAVARAARRAGRPYLYDAHEYFSETPEVVRRRWVQRVWEAVARRYVPRAAAAYTVGPRLAERLSARYGVGFGVVRNAARYDADYVPPRTAPPGPPVVLYQGALNEGRGLPELLAAAARLPALHVWLAGEGDLSASLRARVAAFGLAGRVRFLGYVLPAALPAVTRRAWLGYNLLEDRGLSYRYSLANKAFDYYQAGLPALHSNLPEYRHLAAAHGGVVLVDGLSVENLTEQLRGLLEQPEAYAALRRACSTARPALGWQHERARLLAIYAGIFSVASSSSK